jgi:hypothetical protein
MGVARSGFRLASTDGCRYTASVDSRICFGLCAVNHLISLGRLFVTMAMRQADQVVKTEEGAPSVAQMPEAAHDQVGPVRDRPAAHPRDLVGAAREQAAELHRQQAARVAHRVNSSLHRSLIVRSAFNLKNGIGPIISG